MSDSDGAGKWEIAVAVSDVKAGEPVGCSLRQHEIAVYLVDGTYYATSNICTHEQALLTDGFLEGCEIECPLHGARFDIKTGEVLSSPAETDLETFRTRVVGDHIEVLLPE
ncbi:non-heme iron oxygenase ferredoxin subunit [Bradyrhizobium prioriisuperbiae]|uniref:non-heme iron oxygenase ferredoxin subunit n=1 Tax=Bradyrhizobium prioriisuperbiae TaxID=2854389 RepID=UPI0028E22239|nr:non-heme iron oxygenase ferredoxin subunit [Bradyrhizobium prioritasuperba]